ncbi:sulfatase family protein [Flagellimonas flava]|uniref:sulfatase family protein n=1 Tax=Flagellimonas flava TaxID=570519 RepID=UPI003D648257
MKTQPNLLLCLFILIIVFSCAEKTEPNKTEQKPNIIFVLADDLGYGDITAFNENSKIKTPHLDMLAQEGMRFTDAHTSSAVCTPTRYGILTGRYNWRSELKQGVLIGASKALIPNTRTTVASVLKQSGYNTAFIGKWHLGWDWALKDPNQEPTTGWQDTTFVNIDYTKPVTNTPNDLGFDYAYGHSGSLDMAPYVYVENGMATQVPDSSTVNTGKYSWWRKGPTSKDFIHDDVTPNFFRRGIKYVKEQSNKEKPFFLYLALPSPHTPILPTEEWQGKSGLNPYGDFMMMVDDYMGQLNAAIKEAGVEENTLIVFTSDNGCSPAAKIDEMTEKGHYPSYVYRGHKADIFEGGHRVPYIVKWPAKVQKGSIMDQTICTTDFMATSAAIAGYQLKDNEGEDSYNILPLLTQEAIEGDFREATVHHSINGSFAIRKGDWKLIMCQGSGGWSFPTPNNKDALEDLPKIQLYDLKNDPAEADNLQVSNPEKVEELKTLLTKYIQEGRSTPGLAQQNDGEDKNWEQLWWMDEVD